MKWVSWYQPTEDYRPIGFPPNEKVLGWWCTGSGAKGATIVAVVFADNDAAAKEAVLVDWPEVEEWRFCEDMAESKLTQLSTRFPVSDWMATRGLSNEKAN